jgi:hypothetical protein
MARSQPYTVACEGGLITASNAIDLLRSPGAATELRNFEISVEGGYRRINGFEKFGGSSAAYPTGSAGDRILGVKPYGDGVIACANDGIFFSIDGTSWLQINKLSAGSGDDYTTFTGKSATARTGQGQIQFALFEGATFDYGEIIIADGANKPFTFRMEGTGALTTRTFFTEEITVDGTNGVQFITIHDHHLIAAGVENNLNTVYYSVYNDPNNFTGSGAGSVTISDQVVGVRGFREDLIVFCENSLHKLVNINDSSNIRIDPIAENVGCLSGYSVQEIGGDLAFLAADGIRTIAGTARIGDVELGALTNNIQPILTNLAQNINQYTITSTVIREKSQYRLFYTNVNAAASAQKGIIGTLRPNGFEWSETRGLEVTAIGSGFDDEGVEKYYHGSNTGYIYIHDSGSDFDGTAILARYATPDYDYGDLGTLKTLHYCRVSIGAEGQVSPELQVKYDYASTDVPQPASNFPFGTVNPSSIFGEAVFGTNTFGAVSAPLIRIPLQGSGTSNNFTILSNDSNPPYKINGLYVDFIPSGRR